MKAYQETRWTQVEQEPVMVWTLETDAGIQLSVMNYGASLLSYSIPDREGNLANICVSSKDFSDYYQSAPKWGACVGPVAGRIANGIFELDGVTYHVAQNLGPHHLHSGPDGYDNSFFTLGEISEEHIVLCLDRPEGTGGYPGHSHHQIRYSLSEAGHFSISYQVTTKGKTLINPSNHAYWNLSGDWNQSIDDHILQVTSKGIYQTQEGIPTGVLISQSPILQALKQGQTSLGALFKLDPQLTPEGFDHCIAFDDAVRSDWQAQLTHPASGRRLTLVTDRPTMVVYSSNGYEPHTRLEGAVPILHIGLAMETQIAPDAIHHPNFGSIVLEEGQTFRSTTTWIPGLV